MVQPRRAKPRPRSSKGVAAGVAALALVAGLLVWQPWSGSGQSATPESMGLPSAAGSTPSTTPTPSRAGPSGDAAVRLALRQCDTRVKAADAVLDQARKGIGHWSQHVQAQTDANAGRITGTQMQAVFKRTRLAGPDDVTAFEKARRAYTSVDDACPGEAPKTDDKELASHIGDCSSRDAALTTALTSADDAMADWTNHLAAMKRSAGGHVHDAQSVWLAAWKAAPPHIAAFDEAERAVRKAPAC